MNMEREQYLSLTNRLYEIKDQVDKTQESEYGLKRIIYFLKSKPDIIYAPAVSGLVIALVLKGIFDFIRKDNPDKRFVFPPICVVWEKVMYSSKRTQRGEFYNRIRKRVTKMCNKKIFYKIGFIDDVIDTGKTLRRVKRSHRSSKISYFFITNTFEYLFFTYMVI